MFLTGKKSRNLSSLPDLELIAKYKAEEACSLVGILFERYTHLVFGVCMKYLSDEAESKDAVMQIFEKLLTDLKIHEVENFKSWLYSVTKNHCLMFLRKNKTRQKHEKEFFENSETNIVEFVDELHLNNKNNEEAKLDNAIAKLNIKQKKCIELFYLQEKSYKEVADITGFSLKQVKSFIQNGKRNLKQSLESNEE